jgi:enamine deaminase RidA (YjgF/YER057c/UK114 family)
MQPLRRRDAEENAENSEYEMLSRRPSLRLCVSAVAFGPFELKDPKALVGSIVRDYLTKLESGEKMSNDVRISVVPRAGRETASGGSAWEPKMGYSRAVRSGNFIAVSGTVGVNADGKYSPDLAEQTRRSLQIIRAAIESLGGKIEQVIRTRMYVTDVTKWEEVARVHGQVFGEIRPATAIVQVAKLIDAEAQIEIEADAVVS